MTPERKKQWLHFLAGWIILIGLVVLARGLVLVPEGWIGGVVGNNLAHRIDATPLFYSEVEEMPELEAALREMQGR